MNKKNKEIKDGDIVLGYDKYSKECIIIPFKDRFTNSLIIGNDKESRTINTLLPMINQDLKNLEMGVIVFDTNEALINEAIKTCKGLNRKVITINPLRSNGIVVNPLFGDEFHVIQAMSSAFKMMDCNISEMSANAGDVLLRNSIKVVKRLKGNDATLLDINNILTNKNDYGKKMIDCFMNMDNQDTKKTEENKEIAKWFLDEYYSKGTEGGLSMNIFAMTVALRRQIERMVANQYVKNTLIPSENTNTPILNFDEVLKNGTAVVITNQEKKLGDIGKYMGYLIMTHFQSAIFERPGHDRNRRPHMVYINNFESFATPEIGDILSWGRAFRIALHLATDSINYITLGNSTDINEINAFRDRVNANTRNKIVYPSSCEDAVYYEDYFTSIFESFEKKEKSILSKLFNKTNNKYQIEDFSVSAIINRDKGEFTAVTIENNSIKSPVIIRSKQ